VVAGETMDAAQTGLTGFEEIDGERLLEAESAQLNGDCPTELS
jgi:hypothetical protein